MADQVHWPDGKTVHDGSHVRGERMQGQTIARAGARAGPARIHGNRTKSRSRETPAQISEIACVEAEAWNEDDWIARSLGQELDDGIVEADRGHAWARTSATGRRCASS